MVWEQASYLFGAVIAKQLDSMKTRAFNHSCMVALIGLLLGPLGLHAANFYVRPNGGDYGAENGTDWSNAFDGFNDIAWASISPGDTVWVAGGTYTQSLAPGKSGTAGARIAVRRARSDSLECTGVAGWNALFDSVVHQVRSGIVMLDYNYTTVSGRASDGSNGWWIDFKGTTQGIGISFPNGADASHNLFEYMDIEGAGNLDITWGPGDSRAIDASCFSSASDNCFSRLKIWDWAEGAVVAGMSSPIFEYIDMFDLGAQNWVQYHPNGIIILGGANVNGIVRYSRFHSGPDGLGVGEGIFFEQSSGGSNGWRIYGNIFYDLNHAGWKAIEITTGVSNLLIYNNVFDNIGPLEAIYNAGGATGETKNNLFYSVVGTGKVGVFASNLVASSQNVFVNRAGKDYHIIATTGADYPRNAGAPLTADGFVERDMDGNLRGSDGTWDIGAYEYVSGGVTAPAITAQPLNVAVVVGQMATFTVVAAGSPPLSYQWQRNGANISGATGASYTTPATTLTDNGAAFRVVVSNSVGSVISGAATLTVTVTSNAMPTVAITTPASGDSFTAPANITVNANASDSDGSIVKVEFFNGGTKLGEDSSNPYIFAWSGVAAGSYSLTAKATDNLGAATASGAVSITVVTTPPTASFKVGDRVTVSTDPSLRVRSTPNTAVAPLGTQLYQALGTVVGGPVNGEGFTWWQIDYDSGVDGWSIEGDGTSSWLALAPQGPPSPPTALTVQ
jgi:Bacterial Ig domain